MSEEKVRCHGKHTAYNPPMEEWACPKCGCTGEGDGSDGEFIINDIGEGADWECERLHVDDTLGCSKCGWGDFGKKFVALLAKKKSMVKCPTCKGTGLVSEKRGKAK